MLAAFAGQDVTTKKKKKMLLETRFGDSHCNSSPQQAEAGGSNIRDQDALTQEDLVWKKTKQKTTKKLGVVAHPYTPSTWEEESEVQSHPHGFMERWRLHESLS